MANHKSKIDWGKARQEFVATKEMTLKKVAEKYGVSYSRITKIAMAEKWTEDKEAMWGEAEKQALEETEGSIKELITRHVKVARFLQAGALTNLKKIVEYLEKDPQGILPKKGGMINPKIIQALVGMAGEGLKAERELYPKQMKFEGDVNVKYGGVSKKLAKAAHEALIKQITSKPGRDRKSS